MWYSPYPGAYGPDDPGGGPPVAGMPEGHETRWWWEEKATSSNIDLSWGNILSKWESIETDFQNFYNIDFGDGTLGRRSWRWFRIRLVRLLAEDTSLARQLGLMDIKKTPDNEG